jgi:serine phosphatase RsbU (regulator of sigma subunit)
VETRYCLAHQPTPADAVTQLNRAFCDGACADRFVTLVLAVLDPARHEVPIVSAGHPLPLLRRGSGGVEMLAETDTGLPLGVDRGAAYAQSTLTLGPGDCLTLYTDGVTEAMNSQQELYGEGRLRAQLDSGPQGAASIGARILADVKQFVGARRQSDDICLACFGRTQGRPGCGEGLARAAGRSPITEGKSTE